MVTCMFGKYIYGFLLVGRLRPPQRRVICGAVRLSCVHHFPRARDRGSPYY